MTNKLFDSFVNDKLHNYESAVPEGLWEKIMAEEERKPKVVFWWNNRILIGAFALFTLIGISYFGYNKLSTTKNIASSRQNSDNIKELVENSLSAKVVAENTDNKTTNDAFGNSENFTKQSSEKENDLTDKIKTVKEFNSDKSAKKASINNGVASTKNGADFAMNSSTKSDYKLNVRNDKNLNISKSFLKKDKLLVDKLQASNNLNFSDNFYNPSQPKMNGVLIFNENNLAETNNLKEKKIFSLGKLFSGTDDCPTAKGTYRNDTYVEGYFSPDFAFKNVTSTKLGNDNYLQKKDSSETMQLGFTIGTRFSKSLTNNLLLKAGLQYSQMNEKFTLRTENDRRQTIVINSHTIVRPGQSDTTVSDTSVFVQIGYRIRTSMNYYRNLEIPLMLSYEFPSENSKWKFALNGGAILNLTSWYEGKTIDASYNLVNIGSKANNGFYKHQFGVSLYGGFSVIRNITPELDVFAEPYFRYGLYNVQSSVGFNQRFNMAGLQLGARLKINKNKHL